jgi:hypothetical protein
VDFTQSELEDQLLPVLRAAYARDAAHDPEWARRLVEECRAALHVVLPFRDAERAFLDRLLNEGEIVPELLTGDAALQQGIRSNPGLLWKALNVRRHRAE